MRACACSMVRPWRDAVARARRDARLDLPHAELPRMRSFTFLRLTPEMLDPAYQGAWLRFMDAMRTNGAPRRGGGPPGRSSIKGEPVRKPPGEAGAPRSVSRLSWQEPGLQRASSS